MKKRSQLQSAFFNPRVFLSFLLLFGAVLLVFAAFGISPVTTARAQSAQQNVMAVQPTPDPNQPTPEEAQKIADGIKQLVNQSTDGLVEVHRPDGSVSVNLEGRFQNVTVARKEANGSVSQSCIDNVEAAAVFFKISPELVGARRTSASQPVSNKLEDR
jgi:HAMP domain-containing protein